MDFVMNGVLWTIRFVDPDSLLLIDRTNHRTVATTDPYTHNVYLSKALRGGFRKRVLTHELGHCAMVSYHMLKDVERMAKPEQRINMEEWVCNLIADHGSEILFLSDALLT